MFKPGMSTEETVEQKPQKVRVNAVGPPKASRPAEDGRKGSRAELGILMAGVKCFYCEEKEREQKSCTKRQTMKSPQPQVESGSITFGKIERLATKKAEATEAFVGSVKIMTNPIEAREASDENSPAG